MPSASIETALVWFRHDLRLADNLALVAATERRAAVIPVFIWSPGEEGAWPPGAASRWWLHRSLAALEAELQKAGSKLILRKGQSLQALRRLIAETGARAVFWNRRYEPAVCERDARVEAALKAAGVHAASFNAALLREPWEILNKSGKPFQVFTPFWKHCLALPDPPEPLPVPEILLAPKVWPASLQLREMNLEPKPDWAGGLRLAWQPGTAGATWQLERFLKAAFADYDTGRNRPDRPGTSRLSPHLHFGEISPRQVWQALKQRAESLPVPRNPAGTRSRAPLPGSTSSAWRQTQFPAELGWREFAHHLLHHFPHTEAQPLRPEFARFPWRKQPAWLRAWQRGLTGFPIVDAGMRELWATGWLHNRVRMIAASFLVKDLRIDWQAGARWFWDTLVDADLAQNTLGWQWTAGCGADAAPFLRVFNPLAQGGKFDPEGGYVRRWVPELAALPAAWIHQPHLAPPEALARARVVVGQTYPAPIVNHAIAREVVLEAYKKLRDSTGRKRSRAANRDSTT
jgi:deoxyribodipyrimidine photo-lyase